MRIWLLPASLYIFFAGLYLLTASPIDSFPQTSAVAGEMDLRSLDLNNGTVALGGQWEFYWKRFLDPGVSAQPDAFVKLPSSWNGTVIGHQTLEGNGWATYRLRLHLPADGRFALKLPDLGTAYRLFANDRMIFASGMPADSFENMKPGYRTGIALLPEEREIELTLHVSNFHHRFGGAWYPLEIGSIQSVYAKRQQALLLDLFLVGCVLIMSLYHFGLFVIRVKDVTPMYFATFCLLIALRTILTGERFFFDLLPDFNWELAVKMEYLTFYLAVPIFASFLWKTFPDEFHRSLLAVIRTISLLFSVVVLLFPVRIFSYTIQAFQIATVIAGLYALYVITKAVINRRMGARVFLFGMTAFFISIVNDILYTNGALFTTYLVIYGVLVFVFSQAFLLSRRFSGAFQTAENMNEALEEKVELRTSELKRSTALAEQAARAKTEFLANMSHEIRTPLNAVLGFTNLALDQDLPPEARNYLQITSTRCQDLLVIINDILDISKIEAGHFRMSPAPVFPSEIVQETIETFRLQAKTRGLELRGAVKGALLEPVWIDPVRLRQVLLNLVSNAIKFTESGRVDITLTQEKNEEEARLEFLVQDTGIGIPEDKQNVIFDFFTQVDGTSQRRFGGTGLGLYICRSIAHLMGGSIEVKSTPGKGSEFRFIVFVPLALSADRTVPASPPFSGNGFPRLKGCQILIVEDDPVNTLLVRTVLEKAGCIVDDVSGGLDAIRAVNLKKFDLVLMDGQMPGMDGFETTRRIRERERDHVPIIAVTGLSMKEDERRSLDAGMDAYLTKPLDMNVLLQTIDGLLRK